MGILDLLFLIIPIRSGLHQAIEKPGVALAGLVVSDRHAQSLLLAGHDENQPPASQPFPGADRRPGPTTVT